MAITLDTLGQRYSLLPSEIFERATTFDLEVLDIASSYERYKHNKVNGVMPEIKQDILLDALKQIRNS